MSENRNVPRLRFREFADPWKMVSLGDITRLITKGTTPKQFIEGKITFVKIESLKGQTIEKGQCSSIDEFTHLGELKRSVLEEGDIVFAIAGATVGKIGIVQKEILPANTNQALAIIRLAKKETGFFMLQVLTSRAMKNYIYKSISVGAQPNLSLKQISEFSFISPSLPEQQKIAEFLTAADRRIELLHAKKEKLEAYKKGVMQKIFSQKLRFKADDGSDFPDWEERKLGEVCVKKSSNVTAGSLSENSGDYKIYGATGFLQYVDFYQVETSFISIVKDGAGVGRVLKCEPKSSVLGTLDMIIPKPEVDVDFLYAILGNINFMSYITGSTIPHIYYKDYAKEMISLPTLPEQKKIVQFLTNLDTSIENLNQQITQTQTWKKGLLQGMFV